MGWWLAVGKPENWQTAFAFGNLWGLTSRQRALWEAISPGDFVLFYATLPVGGVIGYGTVRSKFKQDKPLWPEEIRRNEIIWPYRFEISPVYCLPQDRWHQERISSEELKKLVRGGFQPIDEELAKKIVQSWEAPKPPEKPEKIEKISQHDLVREKILEIGRLQKFIAEKEYRMDGEKLDAVWRKVERAVPSHVFEIQVGGDIHHALAKLKHAFDLWNSKIFLIANEQDLAKARELLSGTFHEIREVANLVNISEIEELLKRKKEWTELEKKLGIL